jgi:hypothetical protein
MQKKKKNIPNLLVWLVNMRERWWWKGSGTTAKRVEMRKANNDRKSVITATDRERQSQKRRVFLLQLFLWIFDKRFVRLEPPTSEDITRSVRETRQIYGTGSRHAISNHNSNLDSQTFFIITWDSNESFECKNSKQNNQENDHCLPLALPSKARVIVNVR